jgi:hypothetical protein
VDLDCNRPSDPHCRLVGFRPEKLWINQRVNEPAPFASSSEARPIFVGRLEGRAHPTSGRATIYESVGGKRYLRLTDFTTSNGPDVHVVLVRAEDQALEQKIVKGNLELRGTREAEGQSGDQNYDVPVAVDLQKHNAVVSDRSTVAQETCINDTDLGMEDLSRCARLSA